MARSLERAVAALVGTAVALGATSALPGSAMGSGGGCAPSAVHYGPPPRGDPSLRSLPWIEAGADGQRIIGHLFYYDAVASVPWGRGRVREFRIYANGRSPDDRVNMKVLWSGPDQLVGKPLTIDGEEINSGRHFRQVLKVGPSILNVPAPGCWKLTLSVGRTRSQLVVRAV